MSSRLLRPLFVFGLLAILLTVIVPAQACCGESPNYYFTVSVVGTPNCSQGRNTGVITWHADYRLPTNNHVFVFSYGDSIVQGGNHYGDVPHTPGASVDTMSSTETWTWAPATANPRRVHIEFYVDDPITNFETRSLIVFDCTRFGVTNLAVYNGR